MRQKVDVEQSGDMVKVLVVDDNQEDISVLVEELKPMGYGVLTAEHGREGCDVMREKGDEVVAIVLDREMPIMDGMEFIEWLKDNDFGNVPVVMVTQDDQSETIKQGIDAGVFYYLVKPFKSNVLSSVMSSAVAAGIRRRTLTQEMRSYSRSIKLIQKCAFHVSTIEDAESAASFVANFYPQPDRVLNGVAELIINGLEHGNFAVSYDEKTELLKDGTWREEMVRRGKMPENADKIVRILFDNTDEAYVLVVKDQGSGFDWKKFIDINPARALHNHGRGIAQAKLVSFDEIQYNAKGNEVKAVVYKQGSAKDIAWG